MKRIFKLYLDGCGKHTIANILNGDGILTRDGIHWNGTKILKVLQNEKYAGDILLQKTFSTNHMEKKMVTNNGKLPRYLLTDHHEPIIDQDTFNSVQAEIKRRKQTWKSNTAPLYDLSGKIQCGICGKTYRHRITHTGTKYEKAVWICTTLNTKGKNHYSSKQIPEDILDSIAKDFGKEISEIIVFSENRLKFIFTDHTEAETTWQSKSRKWTEGMKAENYNRLRSRYLCK